MTCSYRIHRSKKILPLFERAIRKKCDPDSYQAWSGKCLASTALCPSLTIPLLFWNVHVHLYRRVVSILDFVTISPLSRGYWVNTNDIWTHEDAMRESQPFLQTIFGRQGSFVESLVTLLEILLTFAMSFDGWMDSSDLYVRPADFSVGTMCPADTAPFHITKIWRNRSYWGSLKLGHGSTQCYFPQTQFMLFL